MNALELLMLAQTAPDTTVKFQVSYHIAQNLWVFEHAACANWYLHQHGDARAFDSVQRADLPSKDYVGMCTTCREPLAMPNNVAWVIGTDPGFYLPSTP